jgi:nicotinamide riboside transporter PnuC
MAAWEWCVAVASLVGIRLNMLRRKSCFVVWLVTNAVWLWVNVRNGSYAQAVLFGCYLGLAVLGWWEWRKERW